MQKLNVAMRRISLNIQNLTSGLSSFMRPTYTYKVGVCLLYLICIQNYWLNYLDIICMGKCLGHKNVVQYNIGYNSFF